MTTVKSTKDKPIAPGPRPSTRFSPSSFTEKFVPAVLILLLVALGVVLIIVGLSLFGVTPSA